MGTLYYGGGSKSERKRVTPAVSFRTPTEGQYLDLQSTNPPTRSLTLAAVADATDMTNWRWWPIHEQYDPVN